MKVTSLSLYDLGQMLNVPNLLSLFRVVAAPIFLFLYERGSGNSTFSVPVALSLIILILLTESTDLLDGFLARRWKMVSDFGKILDPIADSLYRTTVFLSLTLPPVSIPLYLVLAFLYRDATITTLRIVAALKGKALSARPSGKIKAALQGIVILGITTLLIPFGEGEISLQTLQIVSTYVVGAVAIYTLFSGLEYLIASKKVFDSPSLK